MARASFEKLAYITAWGKANPERVRAAQQRYHEKNREALRAKSRARWAAKTPAERYAYRRGQTLSRYGLTQETYDELLTGQGGGCAICGRAECTTGKALIVDHDHNEDGTRPRGILCARCNSLLGYVHEDTDLLASAQAYLLERRVIA